MCLTLILPAPVMCWWGRYCQNGPNALARIGPNAGTILLVQPLVSASINPLIPNPTRRGHNGTNGVGHTAQLEQENCDCNRIDPVCMCCNCFVRYCLAPFWGVFRGDG